MHGRDITKKLHHTSKSQSLTRDYKLNSLIFIQIAIFHSNIHISIYQYNNYVIKNCTIYKKREKFYWENQSIGKLNDSISIFDLFFCTQTHWILWFSFLIGVLMFFLKIFFIDDSENGWMEMEVYFWEKKQIWHSFVVTMKWKLKLTHLQQRLGGFILISERFLVLNYARDDWSRLKD